MKTKFSLNRATALIVLCIFAGICLMPSSVMAATPTKIKGSEVLVIGDSFIAMSHEITKRLEQNAKNAGILDTNDKFRDNSVSGTMLNGGISPTIPTQYKNGVTAGTVKYVIMDGGGNDCMMGSVDGAANAFKTLLKQMESDGLVKLFYLFYPDAQGSLAGTLNPNLNKLRPIIQEAVTKSTAPKGYFLDLRPTFAGKYSQYILSDGIHPTSAGSIATADAIWAEMQKINFFGTDTPTSKIGDVNADNNIDALDFAVMKQYLLGTITDLPASDDKYAADLDGDGNINAIDFSLLKQFLLGMITKFPK